MPHRVSWYIESHVLLLEMIGDVTLDEISTMNDEAYTFVKQGDNQIHAIVDQSQMQSMPRSLRSLTDAIFREKHKNQGMTILINPDMNPVVRFIGSTVTQLAHLEYRMVPNIEEAADILLKVDGTIPR